MAEKTIYSDNLVTVTTTRVMIIGKTYSLRNITSVEMTRTPASMAWAFLMFALGAIFLVIAVVGYDEYNPNTGQAIMGSAFPFIIGAGIITGGVFYLRSCKPTYHVEISNSSGGGNSVFTSKDKLYITKIVNSINDAIVEYQ